MTYILLHTLGYSVYLCISEYAWYTVSYSETIYMDQIERLETQAVEAAIRRDWDSAVKFNTLIFELDRKNEQAMLRIGFAYMQLGKYELAKKQYHKALRIQPKQAVAKQYLERIEILEQGNSKPQTIQKIFDPGLFLESTGKTKCTSLSNLGQKQILAHLYTGEKIVLKIKRRRIEARTEKDEYIGTLADDLSKRLILFIKAKSIYSAYIKEATLTKIVVFIREEKKGRSVSHHISFPLNMQKNIDQLTAGTNPAEQTDEQAEESSEDEVVDDWEKMVADVGEEKEEMSDIQKEDLDEEDEE